MCSPRIRPRFHKLRGRMPAPAARPPTTWSWRRDLNPRPADYKSAALPPELRQQTKTPTPGVRKNGRARSSGRSRRDRILRAHDVLVTLRKTSGPSRLARSAVEELRLFRPPKLCQQNRVAGCAEAPGDPGQDAVSDSDERAYAPPDPRGGTPRPGWRRAADRLPSSPSSHGLRSAGGPDPRWRRGCRAPGA